MKRKEGITDHLKEQIAGEANVTGIKTYAIPSSARTNV